MMTIFSRLKLEEYYPRESYLLATKKLTDDADQAMKEASARVKAHSIHFFLALQPLHFVIQQIKVMGESHKLIQEDRQNHNLTPLHIAVMQEKEEAVEELLKAKIVKQNINKGDQFGWTPLHFATGRIFAKLMEAGADDRFLTIFGGSCYDIQNLLTLKEPESLNIEFRTHHYFAHLEDLWKQSGDAGMDDLIFKNMLKLPPKKFTIAKVEHKGRILENFHGLFAGEKLPSGAPVGLYVGKFAHELKALSFNGRFSAEIIEKSAYQFGSVDAAHFRNHTAFINLGFPNVIPSALNISGVANATLFYTGEEIEKGKPLYIDYGSQHFLNFGPQFLFNVEQMEQFFKPGLEQICKELPQQLVKKMLMQLRIMYPLNNPIALFHLHFKKIVDVSVWEEEINIRTASSSKNYAQLLKLWTNENPSIQFEATLLIDWLKQIDQRMKAHAEYELFGNWVLNNLEKWSVMTLTRGMEWFEEELVKKGVPATELPALIENRMKSYNWMEDDEENLYGYTRRLDGKNRIYNYVTQYEMEETHNDNFNEVKKGLIKMTIDASIAANPAIAHCEPIKILNDLLRAID